MLPPETAEIPALRLYLLGAPHLDLGGQAVPLERRKALALLAYLTVTGQPQPRDALAALLWPEANASEARAALRRTLSVLNTALGASAIDVQREAIAVRPTGLWADVVGLRASLTAITANHPAGQPPCGECLAILSDAAALYRGDFMAGFSLRDSPDFDEWQFQQSEALRRELAEALEALTHGYAAEADYRAALEPARRWVALDPLHEPAQRMLIKLYAWAGQTAAAQRAYLECRRLLETELGAAPEPETTRLYEAVRAGQMQPPVANSAAPRARLIADAVAAGGRAPQTHRTSHLPAQTTPLLGRVEELARLSERLADPACRLVTVFGPGGSGKTRLALQAAAHYGVHTQQPIYFVPLATRPTPDILVAAMGEALGLTFSDEGDPTAQLLDALRERDLLLLDNFEHLLPGAGLLADILAQAPGVRVVVTSRERLHLHGEWVLEITGLPYPPNAAAPNIDFYEAVQLFVQSARQARADFALDDSTRPAVIEICRLVEGLPLGLELAAAWTRMLAPQEIAAEITRNLDFLATNRRDVPARQRSLRAAFEHSWALLPADERRALCRLAIFRRGFVRSAAEQVSEAGLPVLTALADKSLLRSLPPRGGLAQYELHDLVKQFAVEKLAAAPAEAQAARRRHAHYYAGLLSRPASEHGLDAAETQAFLATVMAEIENVRAAWDWAVTWGDLDALERAHSGLFQFYKRQSWLHEGKELMGLAARRVAELTPAVPAPERPRYLRLLALLLSQQANFNSSLGQHLKAEALYTRSLELLRAHGRPQDLAPVLTHAGMAARELNRTAATRQLMEEAITLARSLEDWPRLIKSLYVFGYYLGEAGDFPAAFPLLEQAESLARAHELPGELSATYNNYGFVCYMAGDYPRALDLLEQSLQLRVDRCPRSDCVGTVSNLGYVRAALGQPDAALALFMEALRVSRASRALALVSDIVVGIAGLLPLPDQGGRAIELLTFARLSPFSWLETKERAARWAADRAAALPPAAVAVAEARGRALEYEAVLADLLGLSPTDQVIGPGPQGLEALHPASTATAA